MSIFSFCGHWKTLTQTDFNFRLYCSFSSPVRKKKTCAVNPLLHRIAYKARVCSGNGQILDLALLLTLAHARLQRSTVHTSATDMGLLFVIPFFSIRTHPLESWLKNEEIIECRWIGFNKVVQTGLVGACRDDRGCIQQQQVIYATIDNV